METNSRSLPENAYRPLKPGETYSPDRSRRREGPGVHGPLGRPRSRDGGPVLRRRRLPRAQGGAGVRGCHPDRHHRRRDRRGAAAALDHPRERHRAVGRRGLRAGGGRLDLHAPGSVHPRPRRRPREALPGRGARRRTGDSLPRSPAPLLRQGDARRVPVPRGDRHDRGARRRRGRRQAGQGARRRRRHRWRVRLPDHPLRGVRRGLHLALDPVPGRPRRQGQAGVPRQRARLHPGTRLHHRPEVLGDHLRRVVPFLVPPRPADRPHRRPARRDAFRRSPTAP